METISFSYYSPGISVQRQNAVLYKLEPIIASINKEWKSGYESDYASLFLPFDNELHTIIKQLVTVKKKLNPRVVVVVGIGGSNLGTLAVEQAVRGLFSNEREPISIYFADSVDAAYTQTIYSLVASKIEKGENPLVVVISKSGTTLETLINAQLFLSLLHTYKKEQYTEYSVVISQEDSPLYAWAQHHTIACMPIADKVGGRFSLFSATALFPLGMLDIDTDSLIRGAQSVYTLTANYETNFAAISAALLYLYYQKKYVIHDTFFFMTQLEGIGRWYRQLLAESIGKTVSVGITPTVSIGSTDLHSMAQLYLGGPLHRITTFVSVASTHKLSIPPHAPLTSLMPSMTDTSYPAIMNALLHGTQKTYKKRRRPFIAVEFPTLSAYFIGQFMQFKMVEVMYLAALFGVNVFDQPAVELYKRETRRIMAHD